MERLIQDLKSVEYKYKDKHYSTGETCVGDMAHTCRQAIEELQAENARIREAMKGAEHIANSAGQTIKELRAALSKAEAENKLLRKAFAAGGNIAKDGSDVIEGLLARITTVEAERDAAVKFIHHLDYEYSHYIADKGFEQWRGTGTEGP